jgi:hypothetical protein
MNYINLPNPSSTLVPGVYSASNINQYYEQKNNVPGK